MNLNPPKDPHRITDAEERRTQARIEEYLGKRALLMTWEQQLADVQVRNREYILELARKVRNARNYLLHRAGADPHL